MSQINIVNHPFKLDDKTLNNIFLQYPFDLDDFQKHAIDKIRKEESVLITSKTGSGKSLCFEYAIQLAFQKNKRIIYTSPIKSLSNQ